MLGGDDEHSVGDWCVFFCNKHSEKQSASHNVILLFFRHEDWGRFVITAYLSYSVFPLASFYFARMLSHGIGTAIGWNSREEQLILSCLHKQRYRVCSITDTQQHRCDQTTSAPVYGSRAWSSRFILTWDRCGKSKSGWGLTLSTRDLAYRASWVVGGGYYYTVRDVWWRGLDGDVKPLTSEPAMCTAAFCWSTDPLWSTLIWIGEDKCNLMCFFGVTFEHFIFMKLLSWLYSWGRAMKCTGWKTSIYWMILTLITFTNHQATSFLS